MNILGKCGYNASAISRIFRVLLYSTEIRTSDPPKTLPFRILPAIDLGASVVPALEEWRKERIVKKKDLEKLIRTLRTYKRYYHALETCEWMRDKFNFDRSPSDVALELDLISKVHGLEQAEKLFNETPDHLISFHVYGALLQCYSQEKSLEKAEAVMQKLRDMESVNILSYNAMLGLYHRLGMHGKLENFIQEMEQNGISWNRFTYCICLKAYATASDIGGMEKILTKLDTDPAVNSDWDVYMVSANGYLKAGLKEKAMEMLKKSEQFIEGRSRRPGYEALLTMYTTMGNKTEVYRIWNLYKTIGKFCNTGYIAMITSLLKLGDMEGAEDTFEEWISTTQLFDFRVPNLLIRAYCKRGLLEKAEKLVSRATGKGKGKEPTAATWDCLAAGYQENNQMEKAVETMKKALVASSPRRKPNPRTVKACLEFLKKKGDVEEAENLTRLLNRT